jgi:hypothetical protein
MTDDITDHPRENGKDDELEESPIPDPTEGDTDAGDVPEAD